MKKILLLDIENQPKTENELLSLLKSYALVYLVYAKSPVALSLDGLQNLSAHVVQKRLVLIKMPKTGPDAADFGLAFVAGQLSIQMQASEAEFDVMSNDKKFEYIVDLLKVMGFRAQQKKKEIQSTCFTKLSLEHIHPEKAEFKLLFAAVKLLVKNQPKQFNSLNNALKSWLKGTSATIKQVIGQLKNYQLIQIQDQKVSYELNRMHELLKLEALKQSKPIAITLPSIADIQLKPHLQRVKIYSDYLAKSGSSRPAKTASLLNSVRSILGLEHQQAAQDFIQVLKKQDILKQDNTKLIYNSQLIQAWANLDKSCLIPMAIQAHIINQPNTEILS